MRTRNHLMQEFQEYTMRVKRYTRFRMVVMWLILLVGLLLEIKVFSLMVSWLNGVFLGMVVTAFITYTVSEIRWMYWLHKLDKLKHH